jgi:predicted dehydrogenase
MSRKVNVGVVGLGFMGSVHLRAYQALESARVTAVCDAIRLPVKGVLPGVAGNVQTTPDIDLGGSVKVFRKLEELLADPEVELVDLCTPTLLHAEQAIAALKAGKHVFCEKPLARTSEAARKVVEAEAAGSCFLMPAMCMRFWPGWGWLKETLSKQTYGPVRAARFRRLSEMPGWSTQGTYSGSNDTGGALFDLHIHDTDFVQFLFGQPASVFSTGVCARGGSVDHVVTQYCYPEGPSVSAEGSWLLTKGFQMDYTIFCERATLDFDLERGANAMRVLEQGQPARFIQCQGPDGYGAEVGYIVECVRDNRRPTIVTSLDGLSALEICEAEEQSLRTGKPISLRPAKL